MELIKDVASGSIVFKDAVFREGGDIELKISVIIQGIKIHNHYFIADKIIITITITTTITIIIIIIIITIIIP